MKSRVVLVFSFFAIVWSLLLLRVFILQTFPHEKLERLEAKQYETTVKIEGRRGSIYDRKGVELAMSAPAYSLYVDPQLVWDQRRQIARQLQKAIGISSREFLKLFRSKKNRFAWVERQLNLEQYEKVKQLNIHGLGFVEEPMRVYPDADILKSVLGVVGRSGVGLEGVEKQYDSILRGNPKKVQVRRDARGRPLQINGLLVTEVEDGTDVQLTLDRELQYVLHRELTQTMNEQSANGALGIILDAQTSEILAMDGVGLTVGGDRVKEDQWRNRPLLEAFEPGSTMKTFIIAAGLQQKGWQPNTRFNCENGVLKIGKRTIREADEHHKFGWLSVSEILAMSSNVGMTKMAFELGNENVRQILNKFGFGQKTGVDLPGESKGIINEGKWSRHLLSNISFGHGIAVTPLQIANAYAAIANGGILKKPRVLKKQESKISSDLFYSWFKNDNDLNSDFNSGVRILSEPEAQTLRLLLAGVVTDGGTGLNAIVPGYPVAGKTGTAQKVNPQGRGYLPNVYISSFVGMIPANYPRFVIYVAVDSPRKQYYGSQVAAPLFSRIATFAVRHEGLAPRWLKEEQAQGLMPPIANKINKASNSRPRVASNSLESEESSSTSADSLSSSSSSSQSSTISKEALSNSIQDDSPINSNMVLNTSELMPNLNNLTLREVHERLQNKNVQVKIKGSGRVHFFYPSEGVPLGERAQIEVWLTE